MTAVEIVVGVAVVGLGVLLVAIYCSAWIERGADTSQDDAEDQAAVDSIRGSLEETKERRRVRALP